MSILGYDTQGSGVVTSFDAGRKYGTKFTLTEDGIITELHCWINRTASGNSATLSVYSDTAGSPDAREIFTALISWDGSAPGAFEISETGLSVALLAGDYWLTWASTNAAGGVWGETTGATHAGIISGAAVNPPSDPFGAPNTSGTRKHSIWAVYTPGSPCDPPVNAGGSDLPSISGTEEVGATLTADEGAWTGDATLVFTYQWQRCCGTFACENIVGATGTTYVITEDDIGCSIRVEVTADNGCDPDGVAYSAETGVIPDLTTPVNTVAPVITGVPQPGHILETTDGTWTGGGLTFTYQWEMNCDGGTVWDLLVGETSDTLLLTEAMIDCEVRCVVTATNSVGSASADSNEITVQANVPAAVEICEAPPWRFAITDLDCEVITWLDRLARQRTVTFVLNAPAIATGTVPSDDPRINIEHTDGDPYLAEGTRLLFGFRLEPQSSGISAWIVRYAGIILQVEDSAQQDNADTAYTALDPWQYLRSRPVRNGPDFDYTLPGVDGSSYTDTRIDVIAGQILRNTIVTDGPVFIDAGSSYGGTAFWGGTIEACDQIDINFQQGTNVGDAWDQLVGSNQADFVLTPIWDPIRRPGYTHELSIFQQAGAIVQDTIFGWDKVPRNLIGISRLYEGSGRANNVKFYAGQGGTALNGQTIPVQVDAASVAKYGEYWGFQFFPGQNVAAAVEALAAAQLDIRKNGRQTVVMSPSPDCSTALFQAFFLGDRVPVYASARLRDTLTGYQRIYGIPISIADDSTETIERMLASKEGVV